MIASVLLVPIGLRGLNLVAASRSIEESYIPAVQPPRQRGPFDAESAARIREADPTYIVIGDSMAGTRVDHRRLSRLTNRPVVPIIEPGTGSAFWYLAFKNWVVASGARPKAVIFYFRDENLTDPMFRLTPHLLDRVAHAREPELNDILALHAQGPWYRVHAGIRGLYQYDLARTWVEPAVVHAPLWLAVGPQARRRLLDRMNTEVFTLEAMRPMAAADMAAGDRDRLDFRRNLPRSLLPALLRRAAAANIHLAFVRVQRRPTGNQPPAESDALAAYVRDLQEYLEAHGAHFDDERGDPEMPESIYRDGDHIGFEFRDRCTERLVARNPGLFR